MSTLDIIIAAVLVVGLVRGLMTGIVRQAASLVGVILSFFISVRFAHPVGQGIVDVLDVSARVGAFLAFIIIFLGLQILIFILVRILEKALGALHLSFINRLAGGLFGTLKVALVMSAVLLVFRFLGLPGTETRGSSILYEPVGSIFPATWNWLAEQLPEMEPLARRFGRYIDLGEWSK